MVLSRELTDVIPFFQVKSSQVKSSHNGDGVGVDGSGSGAARALEGVSDCAMGCEGADGAEQGASMAARVAEDDDEDEVLAGDENVSMQEAVGGDGAMGGIKKGKRRRGKQKGTGHRQWLAAKRTDLRPAAGEASA